MDLATRSSSQSAENFLDALVAARSPVIAAHDLAIVIAHPDDETIGCGAQLNRLAGATIIVVTDGAPRQAHAVGDVAAYASQRMDELKQALVQADVAERNVVMLGFSDQTTAMHLVE